MSDWLHAMGTTTVGLNLSSQFYFSMAGNSNTPVGAGAEGDVKVQVYDSYTWSKLFMNVDTNSHNANCNFVSRKNGADGNQVVTVTAATAGEYADASNSDSLSANDEINYRNVPTGGSSNIGRIQISTLLTGTKSLLISANGGNSIGSFSYNPINGANLNTATESNATWLARTGFTCDKLRVYLNLNTLTDAPGYVKLRKGSADTSLSVTLTEGVTGEFEDTSNTVTVSAGDTINTITSIDLASSGNLRASIIQVRSDAAVKIQSERLTTLLGSDHYRGIATPYSGYTADTGARVTCRAAMRAKNYQTHVSSNTTTVAVFSLTQNGTATALSCSYASGVTGVVEDTSNVVDYVSTDYISHFEDIQSGSSITIMRGGYEQADVPAAANPFFGMMEPDMAQGSGALSRY